MKKLVCLLCVLAILLLTAGCDMVSAHPKSGIWYCEELDITLDMERLTAAYQIESGAYKIAKISFQPPCGFEIFRKTGDDGERETILFGAYDYEDGLFYVTDEGTNTVYTFVLTVDR